MVFCISCEKYPRDTVVQQPPFAQNEYRVRLFSATRPNPLPTTGADVFQLADSTTFALGSILYIAMGDGGSEIFIYEADGFVKRSTHRESRKSKHAIVGVGEVDYAVLTM